MASSTSSSSAAFKFTLYAYETCPFSARVRIIFALKNIPNQVIFLPFSDIEAHHRITPGKKSVPVLEYAPQKHMTDSLDIVKYLDNLSQYGPPILKSYEPVDKQLTDTFNPPNIFKNTALGKLLLPRLAKLELPEFATDRDRSYWVENHQSIGNLEELYRQTDQILPEAQRLFNSFDEKFVNASAGGYIHGNSISVDDLIVWPVLRLLTVVKGLEWRNATRRYLDTVHRQTNIPLFENQA